MNEIPIVQPLSRRRRRYTFLIMFAIFIVSLPFLFLYATGYRFDFDEDGNIISTGGMYVAAERTGAEIYIDDELVRETRVFRRAFYAQSLEPGTHRVHVQKEGHHTWVKELPVYPHIVTEAQAFTLPEVPQARVISEYLSPTNIALVSTSSLLTPSTTNAVGAPLPRATSTYTANSEYNTLLEAFATTTPATTTVATTSVTATTTSVEEALSATTTKTSQGVRLFEDGDDIYAEWTGSRESMPYYYCAEPFEPYSTTSPEHLSELLEDTKERGEVVQFANTAELLHPVQQVPEDVECDPTIRIDRRMQEVTAFDFLPGSTDFVVVALEDGVYVVEIDDRSWQNVQPMLLGEGLDMRVINGTVYIYDGAVIYEMIPS